MGFIHDTKSEILGVETRSESAYLMDTGDRSTDKQLFFFHESRQSVKNEIVTAIMERAGKAFAKGDMKTAESLKATADIVKDCSIRADSDHRSFEATYVWIAALVDFCTTDATMKGHLDSVRSKPNTENL